MATNDTYLRPDAGDGVNGVRLRTDAPDSGGIYTLVCDAGAYNYVGQAATLSVQYGLVCGAGAYSYAGNDATLSVSYVLSCATGAYAYTGNAASLTVERSLLCDAGAYSYTGNAAVLTAGYNLLCDAGAYSYTGNDATLTYVGTVGYTLTCDAGAYSYSGNAATLTYVATATDTKNGGDDAPRSVKNLKYKPKPRKDDFGNEIVVPEAISALTVEKYTQKPTLVSANELQSHLEIDDEEAILMFI
jgi:hypothetical protein